MTESRNPSRSETGDELVAGSENKPESELQKLEDAIRSEKTRIIELSEKLADLDDAETQRRVKRVGTLMASLAKEFSPGRINPHLLFRYAAQRGLMEDLLVRR